jgi:hypothetical protein
MDTIDRLRTRLPYTGETPFGSCFQQGAANVLDAIGLEGADLAIGSAWGMSWRGGGKLSGGGRWIDSVGAICGLRVLRLHSHSWRVARERERELLAAGLPVIAGVDSFGILSPHQGRTHLVHAVIVLESDASGVTFCDPMNHPRPVRMEVAPYGELRAAACVERFELLVCEGRLTSQLDPVAAASTLALDAERNADQDRAAMAAFADWVEENGAEDLDVAEVGAERLYAAKLLGAAADADDRFAPHARALGSLARRWYLLHTLSLESRAGRALSVNRVVRLLDDLGRREADARVALLCAVADDIFEKGPR